MDHVNTIQFNQPKTIVSVKMIKKHQVVILRRIFLRNQKILKFFLIQKLNKLQHLVLLSLLKIVTMVKTAKKNYRRHEQTVYKVFYKMVILKLQKLISEIQLIKI